ncbi:MAG: choice-of-anchor tandem repeat NxxGxxAF-containing protein [Lapillicoccus sp.]
MRTSRVLLTAALAAATSLVTAVGGAPPTANASVRASTGYTYTTMYAGTPDRTILACAQNNLGQVAVASSARTAPGGRWQTTRVRTDGSSVTPIAGPVNGLGSVILGLAINDAGQVALGTYARRASGEIDKIVLGDGGPVRVVARAGPGEVFSALGSLSLNAQGRVAFFGGTPDSVGIYTGNGVGPLVTRYVNTDAADYFGLIGVPILNAAGQIAFEEHNADGVYSIYRSEPGGSVTRLYRSPQPSVSLGSMNRAGRVGYDTTRVARLPRAIYTVRGGASTLVASSADGFTALFGGYLNDVGHVVFYATKTAGAILGLWTGATPSFTPVVQPGDIINGRELYYVGGICARTMLNNAGQVAFMATYRDGTTAVVWADPVP